ncbi:HNH endonuclease [uncultured Polaribacter sp.]|uniref:HNH endonuclease n=1 Tax=uncultured Polaribacter sp. TaxID=174711 RepID=UPI0030D93EBD|tara:strand:+ start:3440 stop:4384 length:945 start_codon:yes stop_codon:yes gene_type:complete
MSNFFNYSTWGLEHYDSAKKRKTFFSAKEKGALISENKCFFSKTNFQKYLRDAKTEYFAQEQFYHNNISEYYNERLQKVNSLESNQIFFSIYDASDNLSQKQNRGYVRSDDSIWKLWRELILPSVSYLSILKLVPIDNNNAEPLFYFRILLDYQFRSFVHPKSLTTEQELEKEDIESREIKRTYRKGSEKYRREVINYMPQCPFTKITDERLLIASHIKPYNICIKNNENDQALDYLNGLALSPTYDKLFDQGYITFSDNGELICGTQLSSYTWEKLNINPNAKNKMRIYPEEREMYLDYHRNYVFQDDINDLL